MKAKLTTRSGVDYLFFQPEGLDPIELPVVTKGNRDKANAWSWNGDLEKPTLRPSVRIRYFKEEGGEVMIHYFLADGKCKCLGDCTDGNANKVLDLSTIF